MTPVVVRRKSDGLFLMKPVGGGRHLFGATAGRLKSYSKAVTIIRVDLGDSLNDYDIIDKPESENDK